MACAADRPDWPLTRSRRAPLGTHGGPAASKQRRGEASRSRRQRVVVRDRQMAPARFARARRPSAKAPQVPRSARGSSARAPGGRLDRVDATPVANAEAHRSPRDRAGCAAGDSRSGSSTMPVVPESRPAVERRRRAGIAPAPQEPRPVRLHSTGPCVRPFQAQRRAPPTSRASTAPDPAAAGGTAAPRLAGRVLRSRRNSLPSAAMRQIGRPAARVRTTPHGW